MNLIDGKSNLEDFTSFFAVKQKSSLLFWRIVRSRRSEFSIGMFWEDLGRFGKKADTFWKSFK